MSSLLVDSEHRVSTVELFFDLVFVFAFTQVTTLWLEQGTWGGLGRGLLVICALWWAWASYAWLTNAADVEADAVLGMMLFATGALFVAALAVPEAFGAQRFVFAVAFFTVLASFVGLYALVGKREPDLLAAVLRISWPVVSGAVLIVAAAFTPAGWRPAIWSLALVIGFFGPLLSGLEGWRIYPAHFAERHGLIVIIAIGESLGSIGFGARATPLDARVIVAAVLGFLAAASFWLGYFDYASGGVRDLLAKRRGTERIAFARDAYTYAHLPMVVGIILFAFGVRTTLAHVGAELHLIPALALCCGPALYLLEPEVHEDYVSAYDLGRFAESARFVRHYSEQNPVLRDLLPTITTPTQILAGRNDDLVPWSNNQYLDDLLPNSEIHPLDAGHFAWEQAAEEYGSLVVDWIMGGYRRVAAG